MALFKDGTWSILKKVITNPNMLTMSTRGTQRGKKDLKIIIRSFDQDLLF